NPHMKVFAALGYYDLATPYFAAEYTFKHMGIDPTVRENLQTAYYEAGHMMYIDVNSLKKMQADAAKFVRGVV
ncbi:MAG: peptidase S10, partial [Anaerolinea sp.]|nr:peptidase S10 [Anaerolinea sp.]